MNPITPLEVDVGGIPTLSNRLVYIYIYSYTYIYVHIYIDMWGRLLLVVSLFEESREMVEGGNI